MRDAARRPRLVNELIGPAGDEYDPIDAPETRPVRSVSGRGATDKQFEQRCRVGYERYVGNVNSDNEADVRQKVAAQYALLANSR
ncbi:DUF7373 family lipoprotein [Nocardia nepalensis]|uniref:DUF7373 family lipoprotein n=1 Tax=Nocardia nepalensis TaxID=3375448 RepID=UPI003B66BAC8